VLKNLPIPQCIPNTFSENPSVRPGLFVFQKFSDLFAFSVVVPLVGQSRENHLPKSLGLL
jgi:hypothetical protein